MTTLDHHVVSTDELHGAAAEALAIELASVSPRTLFLAGGTERTAQRLVPLLRVLDLTGLTLTLADERYGPKGHADSNWRLLEEASGIFTVSRRCGAETVPVLEGASLRDTTVAFAETLRSLLGVHHKRVALLTIGADGSIAGILPRDETSFARSFIVNEDCSGYESGDTYGARITLSARGIASLHVAVAVISGESSAVMLARALSDKVAEHECPAALLRNTERLVVFSDVALPPVRDS